MPRVSERVGNLFFQDKTIKDDVDKELAIFHKAVDSALAGKKRETIKWDSRDTYSLLYYMTDFEGIEAKSQEITEEDKAKGILTSEDKKFDIYKQMATEVYNVFESDNLEARKPYLDAMASNIEGFDIRKVDFTDKKQARDTVAYMMTQQAYLTEVKSKNDWYYKQRFDNPKKEQMFDITYSACSSIAQILATELRGTEKANLSDKNTPFSYINNLGWPDIPVDEVELKKSIQARENAYAGLDSIYARFDYKENLLKGEVAPRAYKYSVPTSAFENCDKESFPIPPNEKISLNPKQWRDKLRYYDLRGDGEVYANAINMCVLDGSGSPETTKFFKQYESEEYFNLIYINGKPVTEYVKTVFPQYDTINRIDTITSSKNKGALNNNEFGRLKMTMCSRAIQLALCDPKCVIDVATLEKNASGKNAFKLNRLDRDFSEMDEEAFHQRRREEAYKALPWYSKVAIFLRMSKRPEPERISPQKAYEDTVAEFDKAKAQHEAEIAANIKRMVPDVVIPSTKYLTNEKVAKEAFEQCRKAEEILTEMMNDKEKYPQFMELHSENTSNPVSQNNIDKYKAAMYSLALVQASVTDLSTDKGKDAFRTALQTFDKQHRSFIPNQQYKLMMENVGETCRLNADKLDYNDVAQCKKFIAKAYLKNATSFFVGRDFTMNAYLPKSTVQDFKRGVQELGEKAEEYRDAVDLRFGGSVFEGRESSKFFEKIEEVEAPRKPIENIKKDLEPNKVQEKVNDIKVVQNKEKDPPSP